MWCQGGGVSLEWVYEVWENWFQCSIFNMCKLTVLFCVISLQACHNMLGYSRSGCESKTSSQVQYDNQTSSGSAICLFLGESKCMVWSPEKSRHCHDFVALINHGLLYTCTWVWSSIWLYSINRHIMVNPISFVWIKMYFLLCQNVNPHVH